MSGRGGGCSGGGEALKNKMSTIASRRACRFCDQTDWDHYPAYCSQVKCKKCHEFGHVKAYCPYNVVCQYCGGKDLHREREWPKRIEGAGLSDTIAHVNQSERAPLANSPGEVPQKHLSANGPSYAKVVSFPLGPPQPKRVAPNLPPVQRQKIAAPSSITGTLDSLEATIRNLAREADPDG